MGIHKWRVDFLNRIENFHREFDISADVHIRLACEDDFIIPRDNYMPFPLEFAPDDNLRLYPLRRVIFGDNEDLPQPSKSFHEAYVKWKDLTRLLELLINERKAPLLLNYIPTYKSLLPDIPSKSRIRSRKHQGLDLPAYDPKNSLIVFAFKLSTGVMILATSDEMGYMPAIAEDLLSDIPDVVTI
ncbi:hypothetical protein ACSBR1_001760 [Camellia fascicularis]